MKKGKGITTSITTSFKLKPNKFDAEKLNVRAYYNKASYTVVLLVYLTDFAGNDIDCTLYKEDYYRFSVFDRSLHQFPIAVEESVKNAIFSHQYKEMVDRYMQAFNVSPLYN